MLYGVGPMVVRIGLSYARISGPTDERTASLESQEEAIVTKLESLGYSVPTEYRFRERWSGVESIYERRILIHCRELIASGKVQAFGVYDTDRLARDPDQLTAVVGDCIKRGVEMVFARLEGEWGTRIGQMILYMKGFASITEIDSIKDRTTRGRMKKYQAGIHAGYGRCRYGYQRDRVTRIRSIHPVTSSVVTGIFESIADGVHPSDVCRQLNGEGILTPYGKSRWTTSTIRVIVGEKTYYGHCVARRTMSTGIKRDNGTVRQIQRPEEQRIVLENHGFPPLVSRELWDRANAGLAAVARGPRPRLGKTAELFLLSGRLHCGCGFRMTQEFRRHATGKARCYRCTGGASTRANGNGCRATKGAIKLEDGVWRRVVEWANSSDAVAIAFAGMRTDGREAMIRRDLKAAEDRRKKIDRDARKLIDAQIEASGSKVAISAIKSKMDELETEADRVDALISDLRERLVPYANLDAIEKSLAERVNEVRKLLKPDMSIPDKKHILNLLGVSVVAHKDGVDIRADERLACGGSRNIPCDISSLPTSVPMISID